MNAFTRMTQPFDILSQGQVEAIHRGTLEVLAKTGVVFQHEKALRLLEKNGCQVDYHQQRAYIPPELVMQCLESTPKSWTLKRRGDNDAVVGGNIVISATAVGMTTIDVGTWKQRLPTRKEAYDAIKVCDALENLHMLGAYSPYYGFEGVPSAMCLPEIFAARIRNTTKTGWVGCTVDSELFKLEMAKVVGTEIAGQFAAASPLTWYQDSLGTAFRIVEAGMPILTASGANAGGSAPATIAGSVVLGHAEALSGVVLTQLIRPGARVMVAAFLFPMDMRTGCGAFGNIQVSLINAASNQVLRSYGLPVWAGSMGATNSKAIDFQCGY